MPLKRLIALTRGLIEVQQRHGVTHLLQRGRQLLRTCILDGDPSTAWKALARFSAPQRTGLPYGEWVALNESMHAGAALRQENELDHWTRKPLFSIVVPTYNTPDTILKACLDSVLAQTYTHWELCIADDASTLASVRATLEAHARLDSRVKVVLRNSNGHISEATNTALAMATGDFICLMDHDDVIAPNALYEFAKAIHANPDLDMVYSDEDKISYDGKRRFDPFFKPDWSPEYLLSCMYTAHFACYRRSVVIKVGGFRGAFNGAQDYDFVLRFTTLTQRVAHVPKVLYHWRSIPGSTAASMDNKDYVVAAGVGALKEHLQRMGTPGPVRSSNFKGCFEVRPAIEGRPLVSVITRSTGSDVTTRDSTVDLLAHCIDSIQNRSTYPEVELVVLNKHDHHPFTPSALNHWSVRVVHDEDPVVNIAKERNLGARAASGEYLLFLGNNLQVINPDWIEAMLSLAQRPGVGAVGAKMLLEDGTLRHVGMTFCNGLPTDILRGQPGDIPGYFFSVAGIRNYLAVSAACLMIRRDVLFEVGGFDEAFASDYSDADLCLRVHELGYRNVYTGQAQLFDLERRIKAHPVAQHEIDLFLQRWRKKVQIDPYYSPHFDTMPPDFTLARSEVEG